ncbi:hypothetical protein [Halogeometricum borinquense]|uniref:hypothetical protein n=1 Tax=Halogeometricum borinquense TaxID=60847 RepID=UPI001F5C7291|nr:hypothetical protein [Halogeometricum borinquense]
MNSPTLLVGHVQRVNRLVVGPYEADLETDMEQAEAHGFSRVEDIKASSVSVLPSVDMRIWSYVDSAVGIYCSR